MKKKLALLMAGTMAVASLAGCGSKTTPETTAAPAATTSAAANTAAAATTAAPAAAAKENIELSVAWWGGATRNERIEKTLSMYSELNPHVSFSTATNNYSDHGTAMSTAAASGDLPDMWLIATQQWMGQYADSGQLLDLRPYIESGAIDTTNIPEANLESGRAADGGIYALAVGLNSPCIQYNKTLLDEYGIEIKNGMTVDEFAEKCAEIYEKTGKKTTIYNSEDVLQYLLRAEGKLLYDDGKLGADSPDDFMTYFNLMDRGRTEGWLLDYEAYVTAGGDTATQGIVTGSSWNNMWYTNQTAALQAPCPEGVVLDMVTWPTSNLDASQYTAGSMAWCIPANVENPDEAVALLNWWINTPEVQEVILGEMGMPINTKIAEQLIPLLGETDAKAFTFILEEVVPHSSPKNPIGGPGATEVRALIDELQEIMYYGSITPEEGAQRLFEEGNALMGAN